MNMNMNPIVSVIIPVFNVEKYLISCIESLIMQSYKNIEIILVDDGSSDRSGEICDSYEQNYKYIHVIHQKNEGLSGARNTGIEHATGDYFMFVDSDDFVFENYIQEHLRLAQKYNADLVITRINNFYKISDLSNEDLINVSDSVVSREEAIRAMLSQDVIDVSASAKLYKKDIFDNIRFPFGALYEDIQIIDKVVEKANVIVKSNYAGYNYLQRSDSIMHSSMSEKRMILIDASQHLIEVCKAKYPKAIDAAIKRYIRNNYLILELSSLDNSYDTCSKLIRRNILNYWNFIYRSHMVSMKTRIATIPLGIGLNSFKLFWKITLKIRNLK